MPKKLIIFSILTVLGLTLPFTSGVALDNTSHQPDYLVNPGFEKATPSWYLEDQTGKAILAFTHDNFDVGEGQVTAVIHNQQSAADYQVQLKQENLSLPAGDYRISFYAKTNFTKGNQPLQAAVALTQQNAPWANYGLWHEFSPTKEWQEFHISFNLAEDVNDGRLTFYLGKNITTYFIDDVQLVHVTMPQDRTYNLVLNGDFEYPDLVGWDWEDAESQTNFVAASGAADSGVGYAHLVIDRFTRDYQTYLIQFKQNKIPLEQYVHYTFSFKVRASENSSCPLTVIIMNDESPWNSAGFTKTYDLGYDWQSFSDEFLAVRNFTNARLSFQLGRCKGEIDIDDVRLVKK